MRNHRGNPATYRKDEIMEDPKSSGYQTKDNPLQEAYKALRRLEEHPEAATADVLKQTRLIAETVRQGAITEHERILQIDDREQLLMVASLNASVSNDSRAREAALHRTTRFALVVLTVAFIAVVVMSSLL